MTKEIYKSFKMKIVKGLSWLYLIWQTLLECPVLKKQRQGVTTPALLVMTD